MELYTFPIPLVLVAYCRYPVRSGLGLASGLEGEVKEASIFW